MMTPVAGSTATTDEMAALADRLRLPQWPAEGLAARSPIDGAVLGHVAPDSLASVAAAVARAHTAFGRWRTVPAPRRAELVRLLAAEVAAAREDLARLITLEVGKTPSEAVGEVQEVIDICDFAIGLSRQLYGLTMASERPGHRLMETWHPLGVVGVISAFNFPMAVWAWNAALALVCGDAVVWKPSEKAPLCALALHRLLDRAIERFGPEARGIATLVQGGREIGEALVDNPLVPLVSATGSTEMGRAVGRRCAGRFARSLLELGGNNAAIVTPAADLDLAVRAIAFAAMGTAGQRCTTLRRLLVHEDVADRLLPRLKAAYASVTVGDPRAPGTLVGPLIDAAAGGAMDRVLDEARADGGTVFGGTPVSVPGLGGTYRRPALVEMPAQRGPMLRETFAPILYVVRYSDLEQAITLNNAAAQGLSSAIFSTDMREVETFLGPAGSDCGIANANMGTSGAEIGGAFGGEKETGGGRESGSDSWKAYMRRATNTINYSRDLPLAQGVTFDIG
ncbi:MAG TPA: aldehyde dehydrogenase family protein [Azospirillaceae bacterium]|nr:aldehyde dehydrogenase family protein [Azospirillaceae bacterium]